jgi:hypothetical protein
MFHLASRVKALNVSNIDILKWYSMFFKVKKLDREGLKLTTFNTHHKFQIIVARSLCQKTERSLSLQ